VCTLESRLQCALSTVQCSAVQCRVHTGRCSAAAQLKSPFSDHFLPKGHPARRPDRQNNKTKRPTFPFPLPLHLAGPPTATILPARENSGNLGSVQEAGLSPESESESGPGRRLHVRETGPNSPVLRGGELSKLRELILAAKSGPGAQFWAF